MSRKPRKPLPEPGTYATNEEMTALTGVQRDALYKWVREELLPAPTIASDGRRKISLWSLEAVERARFIMEKRGQMYTLREIRKMILKRWPPKPDPDDEV